MNAPAFPARSNDNPSLDRWVSFPAPGKVTVYTGRVELGQGVLTAMAQIAADELDVAMARIAIRSGDTELTPNEGYTAGSQSIQFGGVAMRQACADVRALFLDQAAKVIGCKRSRAFHPRRQHPAQRRADRPGLLDARRRGRISRVKATGSGDAQSRSPTCSIVGQSSARLDLPAKIFGEAGLHPRHAARRHGACPRGAPAQPRRHHRHRSTRRRSGAPPRRRSNSCATAISSPSSATTRPPSSSPPPPRSTMSPGKTSRRRRRPSRKPTGCCSGRRSTASSARRSRAIRKAASASRRPIRRGYLAHASISPSCGLAEYRDGHLTVWTHCQGVFPLRAALAQTLGARRLRDHRAPRAGLRLLRPQRRRRCRRRRRHHRDADAGQADPRALAARGGIRLRAEDARR